MPPSAYYNRLEGKLEATLEWADENGWYDAEFLESLDEQFKDRGTLTSRQEEVLDDIIERFHIEV